MVVSLKPLHGAKSMENVCKPKWEGGIGFHRFKDINNALLGMERTLRMDILRSKYMKGKSLFEVSRPKCSSFVLQVILNFKATLRKERCFKIGNELKINIWRDPWVMDLPNKTPKARKWVNVSNLENVIDLRKENGLGWDEELIQATLTTEVATILKLE